MWNCINYLVIRKFQNSTLWKILLDEAILILVVNHSRRKSLQLIKWLWVGNIQLNSVSECASLIHNCSWMYLIRGSRVKFYPKKCPAFVWLKLTLSLTNLNHWNVNPTLHIYSRNRTIRDWRPSFLRSLKMSSAALLLWSMMHLWLHETFFIIHDKHWTSWRTFMSYLVPSRIRIILEEEKTVYSKYYVNVVERITFDQC